MRLARPLALVLAFGLLLAITSPALADAAPPAKPPGNGIVPAGQTQVQMLAEAVTLDVSTSPGRVEAVFAMRNQGRAAETMDVRFPLENVDGSGDGYGQRPLLSDFKASIDGQPAAVTTADEPYNDGPPVAWAKFSAAFPPGQVVRISISYAAPIGRAVDGTDGNQIDYILETGAGWYGPIESAVVSLRLPYSASAANVYRLPMGDPATAPAPVFVGREARWEWSHFEPGQSDNLRIIFIDSDRWRKIVALEGQTGQKPDDVGLAIQLAEAYRSAGSERHGYASNFQLYRLARQAVQMALAYRPLDSQLQAELLSIDIVQCVSEYTACPSARSQDLAQAYADFVDQHPDEALLAPARAVIDQLNLLTAITDTPTPGLAASLEATTSPATATPQPQPTTAVTVPPAPTASATRQPATAEPTPAAPAPTQAPAATAGPFTASSAVIFAAGLAVGGVLAALALRGRRQKH
jgi:hypothetical protein